MLNSLYKYVICVRSSQMTLCAAWWSALRWITSVFAAAVDLRCIEAYISLMIWNRLECILTGRMHIHILNNERERIKFGLNGKCMNEMKENTHRSSSSWLQHGNTQPYNWFWLLGYLIIIWWIDWVAIYFVLNWINKWLFECRSIVGGISILSILIFMEA